MIHARVVSIEQSRRFNTFPVMGGITPMHQDFGIVDIELRIMLTCDGTQVSYDALHEIEAAIEQALNGPSPAKPVPLDVALPPGPRKITL